MLDCFTEDEPNLGSEVAKDDICLIVVNGFVYSLNNDAFVTFLQQYWKNQIIILQNIDVEIRLNNCEVFLDVIGY